MESEEDACWLDGVTAGPSGRVRVHLSVDAFVGFPVEVEEVDGPAFQAAVAFAGLQPEDVDGIFACVGPEMLGISAFLAEDLKSFQRWWEEHGDPFGSDDVDEEDEEDEAVEEDPAWARWRATGWQLVDRLQVELGPRYDVTWDGQSRP